MREISIVKAKDLDFTKVKKILNDVTEDLVSKDIYQWNFTCDENTIKNDIANEKVYIILVEGHPVGTFSIEELCNLKNDFYRKVEGRYLYRVALLPRIQGVGYGKQILEYIKEECINNNYSLYLDCWSGNERLKRFYNKSGLKYMGDFPENDYNISIFKVM